MKFIEKFDKFNNSPKGKVIKSIFALICSCILVTVVTVAWFFSNVSTTSGGMTVEVAGENSYAIYSAYYIEDIDTRAVIKGAQSNTNGVNNLDITFRPYDITFTSVNQYAPIVIRMELYEMEYRCIPEANETKQVNIIVTRNPSVDPASGTNLTATFSSIGNAGCYNANSLQISATNRSIYDTVVTQYEQDNNLYLFTTLTSGGYTKVDRITMSLNYTLADFKVGDQNKSCLVVYMVLDYNVPLTELFASQQSGSSGMSEITQSYDIRNDLSRIVVEFPY